MILSVTKSSFSRAPKRRRSEFAGLRHHRAKSAHLSRLSLFLRGAPVGMVRRNDRGVPVSSGIYIYRLSAYGISQAGIEAGKFVESRLPDAYRQTGKMVLMR